MMKKMLFIMFVTTIIITIGLLYNDIIVYLVAGIGTGYISSEIYDFVLNRLSNQTTEIEE